MTVECDTNDHCMRQHVFRKTETNLGILSGRNLREKIDHMMIEDLIEKRGT